jgi:replication-associated recombination protein RarA
MYQIKTKNGYDFFEAASAFQKTIRRGMEEEALYWGLELLESNFHKYAWKRMLVIAAEDVGLANPQLIIQIKALLDSDEWIQKNRKDKTPSRIHFVMGILLCVRSVKSRVVDNSNIYYRIKRQQGMFLDVPSFGLDIHTKRGKKMGKTFKDFHFEGAMLENIGEVEGEQFYFDKISKLIEEGGFKSKQDEDPTLL